jgi:hypothetical protein
MRRHEGSELVEFLLERNDHVHIVQPGRGEEIRKEMKRREQARTYDTGVTADDFFRSVRT